MTPAAILDALMQGTGRRPLQPAGVLGEGLDAGSDNTPARMLALAVHAHLYDLPASPERFEESAAATRDERPIVPEDVRPLIVKLVTGKGNLTDDPAALALAQSLDRHGYRLHPFDVPRLATFVRKHADLLGIALAEAEGETGNHWTSWETLDESTWMLATPAHKANFIADLRLSDPAKARALVEAQLPLEKAEVRLRLIDALGAGLSTDDRPLLESLAGDRAPTVKRAVTRLLARLPGTGAAEAQIAELLSRITRGSAGLLRKRVTLTLQMPANVKSATAETDWLASSFGGVGCSALAQAFGMTPAAMVDAAQLDARLIRGIAFSACAERNWPVLSDICNGHGPEVWTAFLQTGLANFGLVTPRERLDWASAAIRAQPGHSGHDPFQIVALHRAMEGPLPLAQARAIFQAATRSRHITSEMLTAAVALMPDGGLEEVSLMLGQMPPDIAGRVQLLANILIRLKEGPRPS